jgi:hypothetical protein
VPAFDVVKVQYPMLEAPARFDDLLEQALRTIEKTAPRR